MLNNRISLCYVLGNVHDINGDQEGQVPSLEMPCSSAEFHYTEQGERQSHCAVAAQHWPFRTHHPEEMPISNIYWHGSILMCCCQQPVGECHRAVNTGVFWSVLFCFSITSCHVKLDTPPLFSDLSELIWSVLVCVFIGGTFPFALSFRLWPGYQRGREGTAKQLERFFFQKYIFITVPQPL